MQPGKIAFWNSRTQADYLQLIDLYLTKPLSAILESCENWSIFNLNKHINLTKITHNSFNDIMAITSNSITSDLKMSDREVSWITSQIPNICLPIDPVIKKRSLLDNYANNSQSNEEHATNKYFETELALLPESELAWLEPNNYRLKSWLKSYCLRNPVNHGGPAGNNLVLINQSTYVEEAMNIFIGFFDFWSETIEGKRKFLSDLKMVWANQLSEDKHLEWLDKRNDTQIRWAWEYINNHAQLKPSFIYAPTNINEIHTYIFTWLDSEFDHPAARREYIAKMRRAWSQVKYRAKLNGRKQSTYVLSTSAKTQLKQLAKSKRLPINEVLECLIEDEYRRLGLSSRKL